MEATNKKIEELTAQVTSLEQNKVQEIQKYFLEQLYDIRKTMGEEIKSLETNSIVPANQPTNDRVQELEKENEKLKYRIGHLRKNLLEQLSNPEVNQLKSQNQKLEYRIKHLTKNLTEVLGQSK